MMMYYRIAALLTAAIVVVVVVDGAAYNDKDEHHHHQRRALGGASRHASQADCTKSMTIQLYKDDPSVKLQFIPDKQVCHMAGPTSYVGSTADGKCQLVLVSSSSSSEDGGSSSSDAFAASVTCQDTGTVYSIGMDDTGAMTVMERKQEHYEEELESPEDEFLAKERDLLDARLAAAEEEDSHQEQMSLAAMNDTDHRHLQSMVFDVLVLYTHNAECRNANMTRGCTRSPQSETAMRDLINLAITETNTAFAMSMVMPYLNLLHVAYDPYLEESRGGTSNMALAALQAKNDYKLDNAHYLRQLYGADIVVLILDDPLSCGTAYVGPSKDYMFSVVSWSCATG
jgi:hypothetical protein